MKKLFCLILIAAMFCAALPTALAEDAGFEQWMVEQARLAAAAMQGGMDASALVSYASTAARRIAGTDYASTLPVQYAFIKANAQQAQGLKAALACSSGEVAKALCYMANSMVNYADFGAQAADAALVNQPVDYDGADMPQEGIAVAVVLYESDIVVLAVDCEEKLMSSSFIISDSSVNAQFNEAVLGQYLAQLGMTGVEAGMSKYAAPQDPVQAAFVDLTLEAARAMHAGFSGEGLSGYQQTACNRIGSTDYGSEGAKPVRCAYILVTEDQMNVLKQATGAGSGEIAKVFAYFLNMQGFADFGAQAAAAALVNQPLTVEGDLPAGGVMVLMCFESDLVVLLADCAEQVYGASFVISDRYTTEGLSADMVATYAKQVGITDPVNAVVFDCAD